VWTHLIIIIYLLRQKRSHVGNIHRKTTNTNNKTHKIHIKADKTTNMQPLML